MIGISTENNAALTYFKSKTDHNKCDNTALNFGNITDALKNAQRSPENSPVRTENETAQSEADSENTSEVTKDWMQMIQDRIAEMSEKIRKGEIIPSYQIGGQSFTLDEWDNFLEKFDSLQDAIRAMMEEELGERKEKSAECIETDEKQDSGLADVLLSESVICCGPSPNADEDVRYITWYTEDGIFCREAGQSEGYLWYIKFENRDQFDKVMEFLKQHSPKEDYSFASDEMFWRDLLEDDGVNMENELI